MPVTIVKKPAQADPIEAMIAQLRGKIATLERAVLALEAVRGEGIGATSGEEKSSASPAAQIQPTPTQTTSTTFRAMSIPEAAIKLLRMRDKPLRNPEIAKELREGGLIMNSADPVNTVGAVLLRRSVEKRDIVKTGRGTWALREWTKGVSNAKQKPDTEDGALSLDTEEKLDKLANES